MDFKICSVSPDDIGTDDRTFKISTNTDETDLVASIRTIGLLQPPVLISKESGYRVVCGFRRILACMALNMPSIPARILPPDTPGMVCAQIAISDNSFQRPLNLVEQSRGYALARQFSGGSSVWLKMVESTGLASSQTAMDRIIPIADMPASMQEALLEGSIALPVAVRITQLNDDDARALCTFFRQISTGLNVQRELMELITEISLRDGIAITRLIEMDEIAAVMENGDRSVPQKVHELRIILRSKRYPELSKAESLYLQKVKSLKLDPCVQLQPPPFFEGNTYRLTLSVHSRRQLNSLQHQLKKLIDHPDLLPE
jgi:ParB family chromosome partitioning protein